MLDTSQRSSVQNELVSSFRSLNEFKKNVHILYAHKSCRNDMIRLYEGTESEKWFLDELIPLFEEMVKYEDGVSFLNQINKKIHTPNEQWQKSIFSHYVQIISYRCGLNLLSNILNNAPNGNDSIDFVNQVFSDYESLKGKENYIKLLQTIWKIFKDEDWFQRISTDYQWIPIEEGTSANNSQTTFSQNSQKRNSQNKNIKSKQKKRPNPLFIVSDPSQTTIPFLLSNSPNKQNSSPKSQNNPTNTPRKNDNTMKSQAPLPKQPPKELTSKPKTAQGKKELPSKSQLPQTKKSPQSKSKTAQTRPKSKSKLGNKHEENNHLLDDFFFGANTQQTNRSPQRKKMAPRGIAQLQIDSGNSSESDVDSDNAIFHRNQSAPNPIKDDYQDIGINQKSLKRLSNRSSLREAIHQDERLSSESSDDDQLELLLAAKRKQESNKSNIQQPTHHQSQFVHSDSDDTEKRKDSDDGYHDEILHSQIVHTLTNFSQSIRHDHPRTDVFYVDGMVENSANTKYQSSSDNDDSNAPKIDPLLAILGSTASQIK